MPRAGAAGGTPWDGTGPSPGKFPPSQGGVPRAFPPSPAAVACVWDPQTKKGGCRRPLPPGSPPPLRAPATLTPFEDLRATHGPGTPIGALAAGRGGGARALPAPANTCGLGRGRGRVTRVETYFFTRLPPWKQRYQRPRLPALCPAERPRPGVRGRA